MSISHSYVFSNRGNLAELTDEVYFFLKFLKESGCNGFDCSENSLTRLNKWNTELALIDDTLEQADLECRFVTEVVVVFAGVFLDDDVDEQQEDPAEHQHKRHHVYVSQQ